MLVLRAGWMAWPLPTPAIPSMLVYRQTPAPSLQPAIPEPNRIGNIPASPTSRPQAGRLAKDGDGETPRPQGTSISTRPPQAQVPLARSKARVTLSVTRSQRSCAIAVKERRPKGAVAVRSEGQPRLPASASTESDQVLRVTVIITVFTMPVQHQRRTCEKTTSFAKSAPLPRRASRAT
jgi:hypothetical protein